MKKKIICLGIISLFLLTGLTNLSAIGINVESSINKSAEKFGQDYPDFRVRVDDISYFGKTNEVFGTVGIFNTGEKYIEEPIVVKVKITLDSREITIEIPYIGQYTIYKTDFSIYVDNKDQKTHNLKAEVDPPYEGHPNGDIIEENEDNNIFETTIRAKTRNLNFLILLTHSPPFQRLLNL